MCWFDSERKHLASRLKIMVPGISRCHCTVQIQRQNTLHGIVGRRLNQEIYTLLSTEALFFFITVILRLTDELPSRGYEMAQSNWNKVLDKRRAGILPSDTLEPLWRERSLLYVTAILPSPGVGGHQQRGINRGASHRAPVC